MYNTDLPRFVLALIYIRLRDSTGGDAQALWAVTRLSYLRFSSPITEYCTANLPDFLI